MNGVKQTEEINRAKDEIARLADCLKSRRVRTFSRERLLRVQTDLAMLVSRLGEVQRIVSVHMIQRGRDEAAAIAEVVSETTRSIATMPVSLRLESIVAAAAADESVDTIDSMPLDWK